MKSDRWPNPLSALQSVQLRAIFLVGLAMCLLAWSSLGCKKPKSANNGAPNTQPSPPKPVSSVAIAYALGGKGDLSYNDAAHKGAEALKAKGIQVREYEPGTMDDYAKGLDLLSIGTVDVIFCIGYLYDEPVKRVAAANRSVRYVVLDGSTFGENSWSIKFNAQEGSFLAGVVAGKLTKSNNIAFIGGAEIPIIQEFLKGYTDGAKFANADSTVMSLYVGTGGAAFTDPVRGREVALTAISRKADVLYHAAGSSGNGVIKAASENGLLAIGVDVDQRHLAPGTVITSMQKNFDVAMLKFVAMSADGTLPPGKNIVLGLADGAVSLSPLPDNVDPKVRDELERARRYLLAPH